MKKWSDLKMGQQVRGKAAGKGTKVGKAYEVARKIWWDKESIWWGKQSIWELASYILGSDRNKEQLNEEVKAEMAKIGVEWN